jgi:hypothetical protein
MNAENKRALQMAHASLRALRTNTPQQPGTIVVESQIRQYEAALHNLETAGIDVGLYKLTERDWRYEKTHGGFVSSGTDPESPIESFSSKQREDRRRYMSAQAFASKVDGLLNYLDNIHGDRRLERREKTWRWLLAALIFVVVSAIVVIVTIASYRNQWSILARVTTWMVYLGAILAEARLIVRWHRSYEYLVMMGIVASIFGALWLLAG